MFSSRQSLVALVFGFVILTCSGAAGAGPVNINTADATTLARELSGIGLKRAQAIVDYRLKHGPFKSAEELRLVKGIGPAALQKNRELIRTDARPAAKQPAEKTKSLSGQH
jgi:competence protein ComEA